MFIEIYQVFCNDCYYSFQCREWAERCVGCESKDVSQWKERLYIPDTPTIRDKKRQKRRFERRLEVNAKIPVRKKLKFTL